MDTKCRHCHPFSLNDTYASILVGNGEAHLLNTLDSLEQRLIPCVTAVCPQCEQVSVVSTGTMESVLCTVVMWQCLQEWIDRDGAAGDYRDEPAALPKQNAEKNTPIAHNGA